MIPATLQSLQQDTQEIKIDAAIDRIEHRNFLRNLSEATNPEEIKTIIKEEIKHLEPKTMIGKFDQRQHDAITAAIRRTHIVLNHPDYNQQLFKRLAQLKARTKKLAQHDRSTQAYSNREEVKIIRSLLNVIYQMQPSTA